MNIKRSVITVFKCLLLLAGATLLGILLMVAAYSLPINEENKESSFLYSAQMGWTPKLSIRYEQYTSYHNLFEPDALDDITDYTILYYTLDESTGNLLEKAVYMFGYGRYWHGYVTILRPIFYLIDYWDFILVNGMLQISVVFLLGIMVYQKTRQLRYPLAVLASYLLLMPMALAFSLQFTPVFYIGFLGSIAAVGCSNFLKKKDFLFLFFMGLGILTCYFDFLTYPLVTWGFPVCWYLVTQSKALPTAKKFFNIIFTAISWTAGYVGMFFSKWALLYVVCGPDAFIESDTGHAFSYLSVIADEYKVMKETYNRFGSIYTNWRHYLFGGFVLLILVWMLWALFTRMKYRWPVKKEALPFILITLSGPAWCLVFTSHTAIHHFFTYRILSVSVLAFILFLSECVLVTRTEMTRVRLVRTGLSLLVCMAIGWGLTCFAKENVYVINGGEHQAIHLDSEDRFTCSFTPTFGDIREFGLCASAQEGASGTIHVEIWEDSQENTLLCSTDFSAEDFIDATYATNYLEWEMDSQTTYYMTLSLNDCASGLDLLLTNEGTMPLNEYRDSCLNGQSLGTIQLLGSITYNTVVRSRATRLYLAFLVGFYFWLTAEGLYATFAERKNKKIQKDDDIEEIPA